MAKIFLSKDIVCRYNVGPMKKGKYKKGILIFACGFAGAIVCFLVLNFTLAKVSTAQFCGTVCHEMNGVYEGWKQSGHYVNTSGTVTQCVDCHLPPGEYYFERLAAEGKAGVKNIISHSKGGYDPNKGRDSVLASMPDERCLKCHANLMGKPKSIASRIAHKKSADKSDPNAQRCV